MAQQTYTSSNNIPYNMYGAERRMKLTSSASEQNVFLTYVCLINDPKPYISQDCDQNRNSFYGECENIDVEDEPIRVERTKALHELIESHNKNDNDALEGPCKAETESSTPYPTTASEESELSEIEECDFLRCDNANILKLTKMKWLTEEQDGAPDSSSPSLSPTASSTSSNCSCESQTKHDNHISSGDKYLSTILRLDKEHNMFGLSNIAIVGSRPSKKIRKDDDRAVFHQTAIVQICCGAQCCTNRSNTDLPYSLKCGGCRQCYFDPSCPSCIRIGATCSRPCSRPCSIPCSLPCDDLPCQPVCLSCPRGNCSCKSSYSSSKCTIDCNNCYGFKVLLHKKPKYKPVPIELTPRSSSILQKPETARSCHHMPECIPPSSCFPYLMPCFWPARSGAPCSNPTHCFHNPPCPAPRRRRSLRPPEELCPPGGKCEDPDKKTKCPNIFCPGKNPAMSEAIKSRFEKKTQIDK